MIQLSQMEMIFARKIFFQDQIKLINQEMDSLSKEKSKYNRRSKLVINKMMDYNKAAIIFPKFRLHVDKLEHQDEFVSQNIINGKIRKSLIGYFYDKEIAKHVNDIKIIEILQKHYLEIKLVEEEKELIIASDFLTHVPAILVDILNELKSKIDYDRSCNKLVKKP